MPQKIDAGRDAAVAVGLVSSPWWAEALAQVNIVITFVTLLIGLVIGWIRLRRLVAKGNGPLHVRIWRAIFGSGGPAA